ncbi:MAG: 50S ribosome-binding GTPase [Gemmatales bacterium]
MSQAPFDAVAQHLCELESQLRPWSQRPHRWPMRPEQLEQFTKHADDLLRQAKELTAQRPALVVILMGGTGVGKSSLLNALAQGTIAEAAFTRPTTREPIVYLHEAFDVQRLDPALQQCRLIRHRQPGLEYKILVDTPDLDSNETIHRDRLEAVLPAADIVLYVGSQEKYHDQAGWELFHKHKERRAFAFVLNKWDRCQAAHATGVRPDDDLLRDLKAEGFTDPLLFRTCAHAWIHRDAATIAQLPEGEQFPALESWLHQGLTKREIEAIRTKGIGQLLHQLQTLLQTVQPPDVQAAAKKTEAVWKITVQNEINTQIDTLLASVAPHQKTLQRRFANNLSHPFRGVMGWYARILDFGRHGWLSSKLPQLKSTTPVETDLQPSDLQGFARSCTHEAYQRRLAARIESLADRLVANADDAGLPTYRLTEDIRAQLKSITEATYVDALSRALAHAEQSLAGPASWRQRYAKLWVTLGYIIPYGVLLLVFIWQLYAKFAGTMFVAITDLLLLPPLAALLAMTLLYILYRATVPVTWGKLSPVCQQQLASELHTRFQTALQALPQQQATLLADERRIVTQLLERTAECSRSIQQHEELSQVAILYAR